MELGLSLGNQDNNNKPFNFLAQKNGSQKVTLDFCMALRLTSSSVEENQKTKNESDDETDASDEEENTTHLQLINLLPLAPPPCSSDNNGSSENGSSAVKAVEEVSSSPFGSIYRNKRDFGGGNDVVEGDERTSDDETGINGRKKLRLSKQQSAFLEQSFKEHNTLNPKQKLGLAKQLNLRPRQVEVWFQNRRARTKLKQTEVDCEYLKKCCETLSEENRRLHKELQELRALKASNPFYMQSPATTLTMCPSCERVATSTSAPSKKTVDSVPNAIPFPLTRPRFYPFSQPEPHSNQPAAS